MGIFLGIFAAAGLIILIIHSVLAAGVILNQAGEAARGRTSRSPTPAGSMPAAIARETAPRPRAEIVVAVKNEEANLDRLLACLAAQDEPGCLFLLVDDGSTDGTPAILERFRLAMGERARVLRAGGVSAGLTGKQAALELAFSSCRGEVLLLTDGDCAMGPGWARGMTDRFLEQKVDVVLGRIELEEGGSFLARFQSFEQPLINQYNLGSAAVGLPTGCFGNNMAVRASAVRFAGGFSRIGYSVTEDAALLSALSRRPGARVRVASGAHTVVTTRPASGWGAYVNQHTRWNAGAFFSRDIVTRASYSFIVGYLIACMIALPFGFLDWRIALLGSNAFLSIGVLGAAGGLYADKRGLGYFLGLLPRVVFFGFFYSYVSLRALLRRPFQWKGVPLDTGAARHR